MACQMTKNVGEALTSVFPSAVPLHRPRLPSSPSHMQAPSRAEEHHLSTTPATYFSHFSLLSLSGPFPSLCRLAAPQLPH